MRSKIEGSQKLKLKVVDHQNEGTGAWRPLIQGYSHRDLDPAIPRSYRKVGSKIEGSLKLIQKNLYFPEMVGKSTSQL